MIYSTIIILELCKTIKLLFRKQPTSISMQTKYRRESDIKMSACDIDFSLPQHSGLVLPLYDTNQRQDIIFIRLIHGVFYLSDALRSDRRNEIIMQHSKVNQLSNPLCIEILHKSGSFKFECINIKEKRKWVYSLSRSSNWCPAQFYKMGHLIFKSDNRRLYAAAHRLTGANVMINSFRRHSLVNENEARVLWSLNHENIAHAIEVLSTHKFIHVVLPITKDVTLSDWMADKTCTTELAAEDVILQLLKGLQYLHENKFVHGNLNPDVVLLRRTKGGIVVKISNFGTCKSLPNFRQVHTNTKPQTNDVHSAPEQIRGRSYGTKVDIWACGVIVYELLTGKLPFYSQEEVLYRPLRKTEMASLSENAQDLLSKLLNRTSNERMSAEEALHHDWICSRAMTP